MKIGLLLYSCCMPAGLFAFADLVQSVNKRTGTEFFKLVWVSLSVEPVTCAHGNVLTPQSRLEDAELDALLIPGLWGSGDITTMLERHSALIAAISKLDSHTASPCVRKRP